MIPILLTMLLSVPAMVRVFVLVKRLPAETPEQTMKIATQAAFFFIFAISAPFWMTFLKSYDE